MKRRTLILGFGTAAGAGAIVGSGAFSTASAERQMTVRVVDDASSFLALEPGEQNGAHVSNEDGEAVSIDFGGGDAVEGDGLGIDTAYTFDDTLHIRNQGTESVFVWTSTESDAFDDDDVYLYHEDPEAPLSDARAIEVEVGTEIPVGVFVDTTGLETDAYDIGVTIQAAGEDPNGDAPGEGGDGEADDPVSDPIPSVVLDSVSSLLDANEQPLTDDSAVAIWAESTAYNGDEDGNGDAVNYPGGTDIPVVAIDGTVVGLTGPFAATDTDFGTYGNEEFLHNVYDELVGSGTVLYDEGHGQYYTRSSNGGDDFQVFGDYLEDGGYSYDATTDLESDLDDAAAVVITSPSDAFTDGELAALSSFVDDGGVLFLHDQSDFSDYDETDTLNEIADELSLSFRFNDDQVYDDQTNDGVEFVPTTSNFNREMYPEFFSNRDGIEDDSELNPSEQYEVDVVEVTDGDTADVQFQDGTVETVRILGIDTPETGNTDERLAEWEGIEDGDALREKADAATDYAVDKLAGETVTLSFDENEGLRGNYGRLLGFLDLPDGTRYNDAVLEDGHARVYDSGLEAHDELWDLEADARAAGRGLWDLSDPAATPEIGDEPVEALFFPEPVEVTGNDVPVRSESGEPLVALDTDANVAAIGGPLVEEDFESAEGGPGIDEFGVYPFLTNVIDAVETATGPVLVEGGHGQFGADYALSAEDVAHYMRYLEGQAPADEAFIGLEGVTDVTSDPGPDLLENGNPAARALVLSTPTSELTADERSAISDFADAGGAVVLIGTAADTDALEHFEPLLEELGTDVGFTEHAVTDSNNALAGDPSVPTTSNFDDGFAELFTPFTSDDAAADSGVEITDLDEEAEYVILENTGSESVSLEGWALADAHGGEYEFSSLTLTSGETVVIYTDQTSSVPDADYDRDWGSPGYQGYVWSNDGETATLEDANGRVVDTLTY
ncbi:lamin tail domain-containing protein [Halopiger aswanensis]|uniref:Endonuclease YncB(Thermonuclease family) n=1 Tax=Halopiger aswanensis TaxID=148449 RepID=A0A3R7HXN8_9EURY|nr:DUF4350 domain-containing protein [Halopiger aswanensis]RKD95136.1 endonuclease YncB(thermonuclease family) [Halopiger aswanensis]